MLPAESKQRVLKYGVHGVGRVCGVCGSATRTNHSCRERVSVADVASATDSVADER